MRRPTTSSHSTTARPDTPQHQPGILFRPCRGAAAWKRSSHHHVRQFTPRNNKTSVDDGPPCKGGSIRRQHQLPDLPETNKPRGARPCPFLLRLLSSCGIGHASLIGNVVGFPVLPFRATVPQPPFSHPYLAMARPRQARPRRDAPSAGGSWREFGTVGSREGRAGHLCALRPLVARVGLAGRAPPSNPTVGAVQGVAAA